MLLHVGGGSDTEVLLAAIEHWGLRDALQKSIGMFALALWDKKERVLYLARDRMGEKPLYYGRQGKTFLFGSELKALRAHPAWAGTIDRGALCLYVRYGYIPAPYSVYQDINKLTQGTILRLDVHKGPVQHLTPEPYWSLADVVRAGAENPFSGDEREAVDELERLLLDAVGKQMVSDVPLGAFLSGGYDSSLITALMQAQSTKPIKTFSIGFHEQGYNEAPHAKAVAEHLGTEHTELYVTPEQAMEVIPELPHLYDEPFADSSQIPMYLLAKMTREHVTVALSGDGGDELMRGYGRYDRAVQPWEKLCRIPPTARRAAGKVLLSVPAAVWDFAFSWLAPLFRQYAGNDPFSEKMAKMGTSLCQPDFVSFYQYKISKYKEPEQIVLHSKEPWSLFDEVRSDAHFHQDADIAMLFIDAMMYLPDDILVKVDRAAMGVSLETRIPLLDHRIIEFVWTLPDRFRWRPGFNKWALRQVFLQICAAENS
ncbi:Asparagine synthetase [glutamine-hydrolyzing] 1 [Candidatus Electrothrix gigas]